MIDRRFIHMVLLVALVAAAVGCARRDVRQTIGTTRLVVGGTHDDAAQAAMAPAFLLYGADAATNRIGRPAARYDAKNNEEIYVDPDRPTFFSLTRTFTTDRGRYTNHIYRIHFPGNPYSLIPFHLGAGKNTGLFVIVTTNADGRPVLVTTTHTCGCYIAVIPTNHLPADALPPDWPDDTVAVFGETLTARLDYSGHARPRLLVHVRPGEHRVARLEIVDADTIGATVGAAVDIAEWAHLRDLERIPLGTTTTSFFHQDGVLKGHVKGAVKPLETLLLGVISLDLFVGTDKKFTDRAETGNSFYTSLKPWNRTASDMWPFDEFLKFWGWRL